MLVRPRGARFELRVKHRLLPRPFYASFDTEAEARDYGARLEALLARGIVPVDLIPAERRNDPLVASVVREAIDGSPPAREAILRLLAAEMRGLRMSAITYRWAEAWVTGMKRETRLAPGTIRKRVSALAIAIDAHHRRTDSTTANPLRLLPRGFATYTKEDAAALARAGECPRADVQRDRRLDAAEVERIRRALVGEKRPDRERPLDLPEGPALLMLFDLIVDTGLRLREAYTLRVEQFDMAHSTINVAGSKARAGEKKPRQVPIKPALKSRLKGYLKGRIGLMFPFWTGNPDDLDRTTSRLSRAFARAFEYAGCADLTEHDLRHEATCRWFEMRNGRGVWMFGDIEIARIMGWADPRMTLRYASLRGSDLANRFHQ